jgi:hypothetical protein
MTEEKKSRRGRPRGSKNLPKPGIKDTAEFRSKLLASLTQKQIDALPPDLKARLASTLVPKQREEAPAAASFTLKILGLGDGNTCPNCGWTQDSESYAKVLKEKFGRKSSGDSGGGNGKGRNWRSEARADGWMVPAEPPAPKPEHSPTAEPAPKPEKIPMRDPDGRPIKLVPDRPAFRPFGPDEIP